MKHRIAALLAGGLALMPLAASAQEEEFSLDDFLSEPRQYAIDEIAADLAYGFCPLYLAGQFPLTGNFELEQRGFGTEIRKTPNPRFGELEQVAAIRPDGNVAFGGVPGMVCSVTVTGADPDAVLARLRADKALMGLDFQPDPANSGDRGSAKLETFKAPVEGQMLYLQLARLSEPEPAVVAQIFGMAE
jgi:hypothetical protein